MFQIIASVALVILIIICVIMTALGMGLKESQDDVLEKMRKQIAEKNVAWKKKVDAAHHHLTSSCWWVPWGKEDFVKAIYGDEVPQYLFYALGNEKLSDQEAHKIRSWFWPGEDVLFGDFELGPSANLRVGTSLRIRRSKRFAPEITVNGKKCPLYQVGHSTFGENEAGCVNFIALMEEQSSAA